jgi:hypothetical protein
MIQASELRISNWVADGQGYAYIQSIDGSMGFNFDWDLDKWQPFETLAGIQLTPAILEKAGFHFHEYMDAWAVKASAGYVIIAKVKHGKVAIISPECPHVQYIHQLQNLYFALTSEELTIEL